MMKALSVIGIIGGCVGLALSTYIFISTLEPMFIIPMICCSMMVLTFYMTYEHEENMKVKRMKKKGQLNVLINLAILAILILIVIWLAKHI